MASEPSTPDDEYTFATQRATDAERAEGLILVPEPTRERLAETELVHYRRHREQFIRWLANIGKDPDMAKGYADSVVKRRAHDADKFYRWCWDERTDGYTTSVDTDDADAYCRELAYSDHSDTHKANTQKSLMSLFDWRDDCEEWDPAMTFTVSSSTAPRDFLTREERTRIREAALVWDSIPAYAAMSPGERQRWKEYLAWRLSKPVDEVTPADFEQADGFKYASLVATSLDAGLRPVEVGRATTEWVDVQNAVLRITKEDDSKGDPSAGERNNWVVSLREATADLLREWLAERECYDKYADTDALWLTRHGNAYGSSSLKYVVEKLAEDAGINTDGRSLSWYSLRHSVGTYMAREEGLAAAGSQLRHRSIRTTEKYDQAPVEDRREALDRMG